MSDSKEVEKAENFLLHATRGKTSGASHIVKNGKIQYTKRNKETIDHAQTANTILKLINITPGLSIKSRKIMSMRIINPGISTLSVAIQFGIREFDVKKYEEDGKNKVKEYISHCSTQESINKFNTERIIENDLKNLNKQGNANPLLKAA